MMNRPEQPADSLIELVQVGPIISIEYDHHASMGAKETAEEECHHGGRYYYDKWLNVVGAGFEFGGTSEVKVSITETVYGKYIEVGSDINAYGFWRVTVEGIELVKDWKKWLKSEEKDIKEYRRLRKKFRGTIPTGELE